MYGACMAMFGIHFIYRYLVIRGNRLIKTFRSWKILLWLSISVIYGVVWGSIAVMFCGPRDITNRLAEMDILENLDLKLSEIVYIAPYLFDDKHDIYWPTVIGLLVDFMIISSSFSAIVIFGTLLFKELKLYTVNNTNLSDKNKSLQSQLFWSLVAQTLIPIILLQLPVSILFGTVFCSVNVGGLGSLVSMTIAVYPAIDPLPTMFIVTSYRNTIKKFFNDVSRKVFFRSAPTLPATAHPSLETTAV
ncbi:CBN-STR-205 protein [Caenorhabditis brenneri]|uniref:CBN-STR-205 protein n=1 Tax=Caenorhabditis brenneri TaxID=135651 RepID=G0MTQ6_CAEBE|nr:CBN-STR-205 protein [Caenorhabditis brenneri]